MSFVRKEKWFIFFAMCAAALTCGEYAITRPASNALFLTTFSVKAYPYVWLATVPLNLFVIYLYNRCLPKIGPLKMFCFLALAAMLVNFFSGLLFSSLPQLIFFQYAWKDIYVLLMLGQLWSMIHSTISISRAKYLYGCIYGMGTIGAIIGSFIPGYFAVHFGSEKILFCTCPLYLLLVFVYAMALQRSGVTETTFEDALPSKAFATIHRSPVLIALLLLAIFMQVSIGLMEYQFNAHLEINILEKDLRTAYCGRLSSLMSLLSLAFQFLGGFLMIRTLGLRGSHFLIPIALCLSTLFSIAFPTFGILSCSYVFIKAVEFSLFGVVREMLYVPLPLDAKFRAKAIIDVFASRTSKALVALSFILLQAVAGGYLLQMANYVSIAIFIGWFTVVTLLFRRRSQVASVIDALTGSRP